MNQMRKEFDKEFKKKAKADIADGLKPDKIENADILLWVIKQRMNLKY